MNERCRIRLVGIGGGGCNVLRAVRAEWPDAPPMIAVHTDAQMLAACGIEEQVAIGAQVTNGLGTGGDVERGRRAALEAEDLLRPALTGADLVILVAGLGGGTGTGATPVVARLAREAGALTLGFCTLPFFFEGPQRRLRADAGLQDLRKQADAVVVLPNQRLLDWVGGDTEVGRAFRITDRVVGSGIRALWKLLTFPGLINLDFMDLRRLVETSGGTLALATAEGEGPDRADQCLKTLVGNPLLEHGRVMQAAGALLVGVVGGPDLTLAELEKLMQGITAQTHPEVDLHMGTSIDVASEGRIAVTVLASERRDAAPPEPQAGAAATPEKAPAEPPAAEPAKKSGAKAGRAGQARVVQGELSFDSAGRGRFRNVEPTLHEGTDLDVPTFLRRNIRLTQLT